MTDVTTILAPIRYPLTTLSTKILATARSLARTNEPANLTVLHINRYHKGNRIQERELAREVLPALNGVDASITVRQGYLVEEEILEEATLLDADIIVVGAHQRAVWRKVLNQLLRNDPDIGAFLRENATDGTEIMEVGAAAETLIVEPG